jgi:hypothetical protein
MELEVYQGGIKNIKVSEQRSIILLNCAKELRGFDESSPGWKLFFKKKLLIIPF